MIARETRFGSFVAIGDSFTEGLNDPAPTNGFRGWADRLAEYLAMHEPDLRYANLAVRGKAMGQIIDEQLPRALELAPAGLVSIAGGANDCLRPGGDPDVVAEMLEGAVRTLREAGSDVLVFTGFDTRGVPVLRRFRGQMATYSSHVRSIADQYGCHVVDLWSMRVLRDRRAWSEDRLHPSSEGHRRVALRACEALGVPTPEDWREPWPPLPPVSWRASRQQDFAWTREHLAPWLVQMLQGRPIGEGAEPKRPFLEPVAILPGGGDGLSPATCGAQSADLDSAEGVPDNREPARLRERSAIRLLRDRLYRGLAS